MAPVKLKNVVSFSSQDSIHRAENLLGPSQWRRWLCAPGDRSGSVQVEIQLERAVKIGFIDIGNYGSALIEIQVRRSSATDMDFQTIVPTTSCMTPMDSKLGKNKTGVKMFTRDQLCADVRDDYWDRVKVICRQLFKKDAQFGLAFITVSSTGDKTEGSATPRQSLNNGETKQSVREAPSQQKKTQHLTPSWKSNTAFKKTFAAINKGESAAAADLKSRLVKIESTSEAKSSSGQSLGRAAKLILAASERKGSPGPTSTALKSSLKEENERAKGAAAAAPPPSLLRTLPAEVRAPALSEETVPKSSHSKGRREKRSVLDEPPDEARRLLEGQLREFLAHVGPALKDTTLAELRPKFESCLGRKLDKSERAVFKRLAIHAVEAIEDPSHREPPDWELRDVSNKENGWLAAKPGRSCAKENSSLIIIIIITLVVVTVTPRWEV
ncbi:uncharacterized protein [Diadema antillarum]|uniref:uncharacterized protein n=1 Tax=Diadema antillarum TaxID=105358 RepID=UPI003A8A5AB7